MLRATAAPFIMNSERSRLLLFTVQGSRYALDLQDVAEVRCLPVTFPIPWAPPFISGAMNFHGSVVAVLDLARFMNVGAMAADGNILVLHRGLANLAVGVDSVESIIPGEYVLEEEDGNDPMVEKLLVIADGEVKKLAVEFLLERVGVAMYR